MGVHSPRKPPKTHAPPEVLQEPQGIHFSRRVSCANSFRSGGHLRVRSCTREAWFFAGVVERAPSKGKPSHDRPNNMPALADGSFLDFRAPLRCHLRRSRLPSLGFRAQQQRSSRDRFDFFGFLASRYLHDLNGVADHVGGALLASRAPGAYGTPFLTLAAGYRRLAELATRRFALLGDETAGETS